MKTINALNKIKKELGTEATIEQVNKVTTKGLVECTLPNKNRT